MTIATMNRSILASATFYLVLTTGTSLAQSPASTIPRGEVVGVCLTAPGHAFAVLIAVKNGYMSANKTDPCGVGGVNRFQQLVKRVVAGPGDDVLVVVRSTSQAGKPPGVYVNGKLEPESAPLDKDKNGRDYPRNPFHKKLAADEYVVLGRNAESFDSRYFGTVSRAELTPVK